MKPLHFTYFFLLLLITACQSGKDNYSDISGHIKSTLIAVSKEENYFYPVWLPDNMISFLSLPAGENYFSFPQPNQPTLQLYDLKETSWGEIPFKPDINCDRTKGYFFQRLPDGKIGFVYGCLRFDSGIEVRPPNLSHARTSCPCNDRFTPGTSRLAHKCANAAFVGIIFSTCCARWRIGGGANFGKTIRDVSCLAEPIWPR